MANAKKLFKARFWSGCIAEGAVDGWVQEKKDWVDSKFSSGLCDPECEYQNVVRVRRMRTVCPKGQVAVRITMRGYCICPD